MHDGTFEYVVYVSCVRVSCYSIGVDMQVLHLAGWDGMGWYGMEIGMGATIDLSKIHTNTIDNGRISVVSMSMGTTPVLSSSIMDWASCMATHCDARKE